MGLFGAVRGLGRIVRGKTKEGFADLKQAAGDAGDFAAKAAPALAFIPGVGPLAAPIGALGGLAGQLNDEDGFHGVFGDVLKGGAAGAAGALGNHLLGGQNLVRSAFNGGRSMLGGALGAGGGATPGGAAAAAGGGAPSRFLRVAGGVGRTAGGLLGGAVDYLKENPELALAGVGMYQNARNQASASGLRDSALDMAQSSYNDMAPLRSMLVQRLGSMPQVDPSHLLGSAAGPY
jgi:hypothetical protein